MFATLICGNTGKDTYTYAALNYISSLLAEVNIENEIWDLAEKVIPPVHPKYYGKHDKHPDKNVAEFIRKIQDSDAIILASPLYHGSFSGILKNAIDNLLHDTFKNKFIGLVSHSGNIRTSILAAEYLRPVVRSLGGYALNTQIGTTDSDFSKQKDVITLNNDDIKLRVKTMVDELSRLLNSV